MPDQIPLLFDTDWLQLWKDGKWFTAAFQPIVEQLGRPTVALLLGVPTTLALWNQTKDLTMPAIILTLFMGLLLGGAPPEATLVGYLIVTVAVLLAYRSIFGGN